MPQGAEGAPLWEPEDRRRIERALHDGPLQQMVALRIGLDLLLETLELDPHGGTEELQRLGARLDDALAELRALAVEIYPPLLSDAGLGPALRAAAAHSPVPVDLHVDGVGREPPEVEGALYFAFVDALRDVAARDGANPIEVRLEQDDGRLRFTVRGEITHSG